MTRKPNSCTARTVCIHFYVDKLSGNQEIFHTFATAVTEIMRQVQTTTQTKVRDITNFPEQEQARKKFYTANRSISLVQSPNFT